MKFLDVVREDQVRNYGASGFFQFFLALYFSPGFLTIFLHRLAFSSYARGGAFKVVGKLIWRLNVDRSTCYISPFAEIGAGLRLPHATAVVIGDGVKIGPQVTIYQSVTLGTSAGGIGYPKILDRVVIYAGAVVIGDVTVGADALIGANAVVLKNVADGVTAVGVPARPLIHRSERLSA